MRTPAIALAAAVGGALLVPAALLAEEPPAPPTAALETHSTTVPAGRAVELYSSKSQPGTGAIVGHVGALDGNGSFETDSGAEPKVEATPQTAGPLTVRVRVVDDRGLNSDAKLDLTVTAAPKMEAAPAEGDSTATTHASGPGVAPASGAAPAAAPDPTAAAPDPSAPATPEPAATQPAA